MSFLGSDWTWYPATNSKGEMNIVDNPVSVVASRILHLLLTQRGEDPIHPTLGMAPKLFTPLSAPSVQYFVYQIREEILRWNQAARIGLTELSVEIEPMTEYRNDIQVSIKFSIKGSAPNTLAFGYWEYTGISYGDGIENFRQSLLLNGNSFSFN